MKKIMISLMAIFLVLVVATTSFASDKTIQEQLEAMKNNVKDINNGDNE